MNSPHLSLVVLTLLLASCATGTIGNLKNIKVELEDEVIADSLDKAMQSYQRYLEQFPESEMAPESTRRLADLKIKKEYDVPESGAKVKQPEPATPGKTTQPTGMAPSGPAFPDKDTGKKMPSGTGNKCQEAISDFGQRTTSGNEFNSALVAKAIPDMAGADLQSAKTQEAIELYQKLLKDYPNYELNDQALYQLARSYEELGNTEEAMKMMNRLVKDFPSSNFIADIQFRRGEYFYARKRFAEARDAYEAVVDVGDGSPFYDFALYKLGWSYYKQEQYEGAIHQFIMLLDKAAMDYGFENPKGSAEEKRIDETYRVLSLSFSNLGGVDAVKAFFSKRGERTYESSVYKALGDHYLDKHRYSDAAATFKAFAKSYRYHKMSPYFDAWVIESYKKGRFSRLFIEANKEYVASYGSKSAYWAHFDINSSAEVTNYVKASMKNLINYYHAQYQDKRLAASKDENFHEAMKHYLEFLNSFPKDERALPIHFQLAEMLLENKWYGQAAMEYEHIAYDYPSHEKSSDAGYAAIYAHRKNLAIIPQNEKERVRRDVIRSSLKFAESYPKNEKTTLAMGAALDDIYSLKEYSYAASTARKLLAQYAAEQPDRRAAWLIFAHSSFELGSFKDAEEGYLNALKLTPENDASRPGLVENLAASLYMLGEQASRLGDHKTAAAYFLLVGTEAPSAKIRPAADFDGATALMQLKDWDAVVKVLHTLRQNYPGHALQPDVTKKIALSYKESGKLPLAAAEYERVGAEAQDMTVRRTALELAADLYIRAKEIDKAHLVYRRYVGYFPKPLEYALEMRSKIAAHEKSRGNTEAYLSELRQIMQADAGAGPERTDRTRYLGATSALVFAELSIKQFAGIRLVKPIETTLFQKKDAMKIAKERLENLIDYEVGDVTSAATFYLADMYYDFSRALVESERPGDLDEQEKEQYELSIEEQAYSFEEKTIHIHQKNLELMMLGVYNPWIEKSIGKLAKLVPARYAKFEERSGYIQALDTASYATLTGPKRANPEPVHAALPSAAATAPARLVAPAQKTGTDQSGHGGKMINNVNSSAP